MRIFQATSVTFNLYVLCLFRVWAPKWITSKFSSIYYTYTRTILYSKLVMTKRRCRSRWVSSILYTSTCYVNSLLTDFEKVFVLVYEYFGSNRVEPLASEGYLRPQSQFDALPNVTAFSSRCTQAALRLNGSQSVSFQPRGYGFLEVRHLSSITNSACVKHSYEWKMCTCLLNCLLSCHAHACKVHIETQRKTTSENCAGVQRR